MVWAVASLCVGTVAAVSGVTGFLWFAAYFISGLLVVNAAVRVVAWWRG